MRHRFLALSGVLAVALWCLKLTAATVGGQAAGAKAPAPATAPAKAAAAMKTSWGEPDLQGIWYAYEDVPLQRPAEYAGRPLLTDAEVAAREARKGWIQRVAE